MTTLYVDNIAPNLQSKISAPNLTLPSGSVIQVQSFSHTTRLNTNSESFVPTSTAVSITPTSSSSKILVFVSSGTDVNNTITDESRYTLYRDSTNLGDSTVGFGMAMGLNVRIRVPVAFQYLDSPSTTNQITYTLYVRSQSNTSTVEWNGTNNTTHAITAMEIAG